MHEDQRLRSLDGLRGAAILLVMGFHFFYYNPSPYAETELYPFGDAMFSMPIFKYGYLGVELFFLVSGFVIALTLENCKTPIEFLVRRFARIWPALLACSLLTYLVMSFSKSPFAVKQPQSFAEFIPTLTLTPPAMWSWAFPRVDLVDGVYWTLLIEARFYMIAMIIFWSFSKANLARNLVIFTYINILLRAALHRLMPGSNEIYSLILIPDFMPWFAAGAVFFEVLKERIGDRFALLLLFLTFFVIARSSTFESPERSPIMVSVIALGFFFVFWLVAKRAKSTIFLETKWLVFVGLGSYSIYLLHHSIGMALISSLPKDTGILLEVSGVLFVVAVMMGLGFMSYIFVETPFRKLINSAMFGLNEAKVEKDGLKGIAAE